MWPFLLIVVLLAVNGFFVALEFALVVLVAAGSSRSLTQVIDLRFAHSMR